MSSDFPTVDDYLRTVPTQERSRRVVDAVLTATAEQLTENADGPTITTVCRALSTPRGIFYRYFSDIESVVSGVAVPYLTELCHQARVDRTNPTTGLDESTRRFSSSLLDACSHDPLAKSLFVTRYTTISVGRVVHRSVAWLARHNAAAAFENPSTSQIDRLRLGYLLAFAGVQSRPDRAGRNQTDFDTNLDDITRIVSETLGNNT